MEIGHAFAIEQGHSCGEGFAYGEGSPPLEEALQARARTRPYAAIGCWGRIAEIQLAGGAEHHHPPALDTRLLLQSRALSA